MRSCSRSLPGWSAASPPGWPSSSPSGFTTAGSPSPVTALRARPGSGPGTPRGTDSSPSRATPARPGRTASGSSRCSPCSAGAWARSSAGTTDWPYCSSPTCPRWPSACWSCSSSSASSTTRPQSARSGSRCWRPVQSSWRWRTPSRCRWHSPPARSSPSGRRDAWSPGRCPRVCSPGSPGRRGSCSPPCRCSRRSGRNAAATARSWRQPPSRRSLVRRRTAAGRPRSTTIRSRPTTHSRRRACAAELSPTRCTDCSSARTAVAFLRPGVPSSRWRRSRWSCSCGARCRPASRRGRRCSPSPR